MLNFSRLEILGLPIPLTQLAVGVPGDGPHNPELLAQSPDGMVVRFHFGSPDHDTVGRLKIASHTFQRASEKVYEKIKVQNANPADAGAWDVEERFNNVWPPLHELLNDSKLWVDAFENYMFDLLRLVLDPPNSKTRYVVQAISRDCTITENGLELILALSEVRAD